MTKRFKMRETLDLLIFDMDGVLIDVSDSYRKTIARTIRIYLETCFEIKLKPITNADLSRFKSAGGFNNDWDLTSGFLHYLLSLSTIPHYAKRRRFSDIKETISYLKAKSYDFRPATINLSHKKHLMDFLKKVKTMGGGLKGVRRALGNSWEGWVYGDGGLDRENLVKRIFQEIYLGQKFVSFYRLPRLFYKGKGYYLQERLLIPRRTLSTLRKKMRLGIASGRPRFEAELALKRFHLLPYFDSVVTLDECEEEERRILHATGKKVKRSKPHPYPILRTVQGIGISHPRSGYVGDVVDDMLAAKAAQKKIPMLAIGFLSNRLNRKSSKESLIRAGADWVIGTPPDLLQLTHGQPA